MKQTICDRCEAVVGPAPVSLSAKYDDFDLRGNPIHVNLRSFDLCQTCWDGFREWVKWE